MLTGLTAHDSTGVGMMLVLIRTGSGRTTVALSTLGGRQSPPMHPHDVVTSLVRPVHAMSSAIRVICLRSEGSMRTMEIVAPLITPPVWSTFPETVVPVADETDALTKRRPHPRTSSIQTLCAG